MRLSRAFTVLKAVFKLNWYLTTRYKGWFLFFIAFPVMFSVLPIFLGRAVAGDPARASQSFYQYTGTENYVVYMIVGSSIWVFAMSSLWGFGMWLREQQMTGTLEQLLLSPVNPFLLLVGEEIFNLIISAFQFTIALLAGSGLFGALGELLNIRLLYSAGILLLGMIPMYGLSMVFGGMIIKLKEAGAIIGILQMALGFIMGIFYPLTLLPLWVRVISILFPLTIVNNDIRAILLSTSYIFSLRADILLLLAYMLMYPLLGFWIYERVMASLKRGEGIGGY